MPVVPATWEAEAVGSLKPRTFMSIFPAQATLCMVCDIFKKGECVQGKGNCTLEEGSACRTRDVYHLNVKDGWIHNHTILDCANPCKAWKLYHTETKVSIFCCKGQDFCNRYRGKLRTMKTH
uniref:UPAR/Ly6 domain-containing protein n=1 Tax=Prolemur simus TaxID=1328070 RepID=A0A8C8YSH0_PROSS